MENQFLSKIIKIIKKNYIQISISLIILLTITKTTTLIKNHKKDSFFLKQTHKNKNNNFRHLFKQEYLNNNINNFTEFNYNEDYMFLTNISFYNYFGKWSDLIIKENIFDNNFGEVQISFYQSLQKNYLTNIENSSDIYIFIELTDGKYRDSIIRLNFTINFPNNFNKIISDSITNNKTINLNTVIKTMNIFYIELFNDLEINSYNETELNITFHPIKKIFKSNYNYNMASTLFSKIEMKLNNKKESFSISFEASMEKTNDINNIKNILNYSIILTFLGLIQIYSCTKYISELSENIQLGLNTDLITIVIQIIWDSIICAINFYFGISNDDKQFEFGTPSMCYFTLFSIFQLRILFISWRARYIELEMNDINLFRKKLLKFYMIFYCILFFSLICFRIIYQFFFLTVIFFSSMWMFQIYLSCHSGTKPPFSFQHIFIITISKIFIVCYVKGYKENIFHLKPNLNKVFIISLILIIEMLILFLQKILGPKFFIPKMFKKIEYDYYRENIENVNDECVICLEPLSKKIQKEDYEENENENDLNEFEKMGKNLIKLIKKLKNNKNKKNFMITPCNHTFHSICLEIWLDKKNECPFCRRKIPPISYD